MRLIDADALVEKFAHPPEMMYTNVVLDVIRSAPTIIAGGRNPCEARIIRTLKKYMDEAHINLSISDPTAWALRQTYLHFASEPPKDDEDLISRAAAIAEIEDYIEEYSDVDPGTGLHNPKWCAMVEAKDVLAKLPAAHRPGRERDHRLG